jgi:alpha-2-macroglobulin
MPDNTLRARFGAVVGKLPSKFWLPTMGLLVAACITASEVPKPSAFNTLVPKAADSNDAQGAFTVVHHGPVDVAATDATINLVFSKPLRTLDAHDEDAPIAINLTPSIEGKWHWVGTHGVQFHPTAGRLPLGKKIHVSVPAALTAVSGEQLGKPLEFSFATSTPRLEEFEPNDGATSQALKPNISLRFDQAVDPRELAEKTRLRVAGKAVEFTLAMDSNNDAKRWLLTPKNALPRATQVHVEVQAGLHSVGGDVPSPHAHNFSFYTYAPLTATARCGWSECAPESSVSIELSNAVTLAELKQRVSITPAVALEWPDWYDADTSSTSFTFTFKGKPRTSYQLNIARGLTDEFGQELQGPNSFTFHTSDYWSSLSVGVSGQILQPTTLRAVPVRSRNVASYDLTVTPANEQTVLQYQRHQWDAPELATTSGVLQRVNPGITNRFHDQLVDLTPALSRKNGDAQAPARGAVLFTTSYTPGKGSSPTAERKLVQVTDLGLTAKLTKRGTVVWVTRMSTGQPLPGASVELWHDKELRHTYLTDADGITTIPQDAFVPRFYEEGGRYGLVARFEGDWIAQAENTFLGAWRLPVYPELYPTDTKTTYLFTERGVYRPGDKVWVKGIVREEADTRAAGAGGMVAVADRQFELQLFDPNDTAIVTTAVKTNTFGTFAYQLTVPESAALGSFRVTLKDPSQQAPAYDLPTAYFAVAEYEPAEFSVAASAERNSYITGSKATFSVHSEFLYGSPVSAGDVHYTITYEPSNFTPPNSADYETTDNAYQSGRDSQVPNYGLVVEGDNKLDAAGTLRVQPQLQVQGQTSPLNIRFESSVTDVARKTISGSTHTLLHPADFYLGLKRLEDWFVSAPSAFRPQVVAFSSSGQRVVGKTVQLELVRRRWASVREVWEQGYRQVYKQLDDVVTRCTLRTAQAEQ